MSGWKVISFEPVKSRRNGAIDSDAYENYTNPNRVAYNEYYGDYLYDEDPDEFGVDGEDSVHRDRRREAFEVDELLSPADRLMKVMGQQYNAGVDTKHGAVFAIMGGYHAPWESALVDTQLMWDKAVVVEANDTSDTGHCHVFDRTWDGSRGKVNSRVETRPLPADGPAFDDYGGIESQYKVDEFQEQESRDGRPVGEKAAAYAAYEWDVHTRAGRPLGWGWDHTRVEQHEWRYRVCLLDPTGPMEATEGLFGRTHDRQNRVMESDRLWESRHAASGHAAIVGRETGLESWVEPVPCNVHPMGGIEDEFDPTAYPGYSPAMDQKPRKRKLRELGVIDND